MADFQTVIVEDECLLLSTSRLSQDEEKNSKLCPSSFSVRKSSIYFPISAVSFQTTESAH